MSLLYIFRDIFLSLLLPNTQDIKGEKCTSDAIVEILFHPQYSYSTCLGKSRMS